MRILITGGTGLLGKSLIESAGSAYEISATYTGEYRMENSRQVSFHKLDIRDKEAHRVLFDQFKPQVVIHTAGIGSPDYAQMHRQETWDINVCGTQNIIENCRRSGCSLIYISSNAVYDGEHPPYREDSPMRPLNYYGSIKLEGENLVRSSGLRNAVVRPILMYGWPHSFERPNVITIALSKLRKLEKIFVYDTVFADPLYAPDCAQAIWLMITQGVYDTFNIGGSKRASIWEFVSQATEVFGLNKNLVVAVEQSYFKELVERPRDTTYDITKARRALKIEPLPFTEGLIQMRGLDGAKK